MEAVSIYGVVGRLLLGCDARVSAGCTLVAVNGKPVTTMRQAERRLARCRHTKELTWR